MLVIKRFCCTFATEKTSYAILMVCLPGLL
jgi:hypothetical protein